MADFSKREREQPEPVASCSGQKLLEKDSMMKKLQEEKEEMAEKLRGLEKDRERIEELIEAEQRNNLRVEMQRALADFKEEQMERDRANQMLLMDLMSTVKNLKGAQLGDVEAMIFVDRKRQDGEEAELENERKKRPAAEREIQEMVASWKEQSRTWLQQMQEKDNMGVFREFKKEVEEREIAYLELTERLLAKIKYLEQNQAQREEEREQLQNERQIDLQKSETEDEEVETESLSDAKMDAETQTGEFEEQDNLKVREVEGQYSLKKDKEDQIKERERWKKQITLWEEASERWKKEKQSWKEERESQRKERESFVAEIQRLEEESKSQKKVRESWEKELALLQKERERRKKERQSWKKERERQKKERASCEDEIVRLEEERESRKKERESWEKELEHLKKESESREKERESWEEMKRNWQQEKGDWERERDNWEKEKRLIAKERKAARKISFYGGMQLHHDVDLSLALALLQHIYELQTSNSVFKEQDSAIQVLEQEKEHQTKEKQIWKKQRALWEQEAEKCAEKRKGLENEIESWKRKLGEALMEIQSMKDTKKETNKCKLKELEKRNAEIQRNNTELQTSIRHLQERAEKAESVNEHMVMERKSWEEDRKRWEKERESWEKKASDAEMGSQSEAKKDTEDETGQGKLQQNVPELQASFQQLKEGTQSVNVLDTKNDDWTSFLIAHEI
ncbi:hypothetical protein QTP70_011863 [Hemibagrus guttatus]|uniref:BZIP domain-containing protein n=1 Tax=Hemibagrus guttatus TaxID=175788 RepID=A0AAE0R929_9TELE|nr:hypothetical protein QTP70_011863 [Hemibagrus guttatus]